MEFFRKKPNDELAKVEKEVKKEAKPTIKPPVAPKVSPIEKARQEVKDHRASIIAMELQLQEIVANRSRNIQYNKEKLAKLEEKLWSLGG